MPRLAKLALAAAAVGLAVPLLGSALLLFTFQSRLLFHPTDEAPETIQAVSEDLGASALTIESEAGALRGALVPGDCTPPCPTVIYFSGNAEAVWRSAYRMRWLRDLGFNIAFAAYRGYDGSGGSPSADGLLDDSLLVYDAVSRHPRVAPDKIAVWGFSLGTGPATHVASQRRVWKLVLAAPYDALSEVAAHHFPFFPVRTLFRHEIRNVDFAQQTTAPTLIVHGGDDQVIPAVHSEKLERAFRREVRRVVLPHVRHNQLPVSPAFNDLARSFLVDESR